MMSESENSVQAKLRRTIPVALKKSLFEESRQQCSICGAKSYLQLAHIKALHLGGTHDPENIIVLCPTCHSMVDRAALPADVLSSAKRAWVEDGILGAEQIFEYLKAVKDIEKNGLIIYLEQNVRVSELESWKSAYEKYRHFDHFVEEIANKIANCPNEDEFIVRILKPLLEALGFERVTVLHHTSRPERGKDIVFCDRDRFGNLTFYAVVATIKQIHANSSKTSDAGHYQKIIDQISKCYQFPYKDYNLKGEFFIDKVVIATASTITDEAQEALSLWEQTERRHLIYLTKPDIAGILLKLGDSLAQCIIPNLIL